MTIQEKKRNKSETDDLSVPTEPRHHSARNPIPGVAMKLITSANAMDSSQSRVFLAMYADPITSRVMLIIRLVRLYGPAVTNTEMAPAVAAVDRAGISVLPLNADSPSGLWYVAFDVWLLAIIALISRLKAPRKQPLGKGRGKWRCAHGRQAKALKSRALIFCAFQFSRGLPGLARLQQLATASIDLV